MKSPRPPTLNISSNHYPRTLSTNQHEPNYPIRRLPIYVGTSRLVAQQREMACMKVWTGSPQLFRRESKEVTLRKRNHPSLSSFLFEYFYIFSSEPKLVHSIPAHAQRTVARCWSPCREKRPRPPQIQGCALLPFSYCSFPTSDFVKIFCVVTNVVTATSSSPWLLLPSRLLATTTLRYKFNKPEKY